MNRATKPSSDGTSKYAIFIVLALAFVLSYSIYYLDTKPKLWTDEAVSIELAKNFATHGSLDLLVAPGETTGFGFLLQSTGYPVTVPLAAVISVFGYSLSLARVYMLLWLVGTLLAVFFIGKRLFDERTAVLSVLLMATFATFYANGRTVVGEVPGFLLLLLGIYFWAERKNYPLAGIFMGLAVVAKPSVFLLVIPTIALTLLIEPKTFLKRVFYIALGMLPAAMLWFGFVLGGAPTRGFISTLRSFYANPYSSVISENVSANLASFFHSTTLVYFSLLLLILIAARYFVAEKMIARLYDFIFIYSVFAFVYYLRSPGWLRYIFIAELLILFILPHAVALICNRAAKLQPFRWAGNSRTTVLIISALAAVQLFHLFYGADIFYSDSATRLANYLDTTYEGKSVLIFNGVDAYSEMRNPNRRLVQFLTGLPTLGENPLTVNRDLPDVIVSGPDDMFLKEGDAVLTSEYVIKNSFGGYNIYEHESR